MSVVRSRGYLVAGCGFHGSRRARALARVPGARVSALFDPDFARAEALASELGRVCGTAPRVADSIEDALGWGAIDAVAVATPHADHRRTVSAALAAGKHALCEKPLDIDPEGARELVDSARGAGLLLAVGFNHRLFPPVRDALRAVRSGALGTVRSLRIEIGHWAGPEFLGSWHADPSVSGGGTLSDNGPHAVDLARLFLGELDESGARCSLRRDPALASDPRIEIEASARIPARENGASVEILSSWRRRSGYLSMRLRGDRGELRVETAPWSLDGVGGRRRYLGARVAERLRFPSRESESSLVAESAAFHRSMDDPGRPEGLLATGFDGLRAAEIVARLRASDAAGGKVGAETSAAIVEV